MLCTDMSDVTTETDRDRESSREGGSGEEREGGKAREREREGGREERKHPKLTILQCLKGDYR